MCGSEARLSAEIGNKQESLRITSPSLKERAGKDDRDRGSAGLPLHRDWPRLTAKTSLVTGNQSAEVSLPRIGVDILPSRIQMTKSNSGKACHGQRSA